MPELSLALNADVNAVATGGIITVNQAIDLCFILTNCTSFKLQGSMDAGVTYNDIAGSSTKLGASGTLTLGNTYVESLTNCRFDHVKPVFAGTNPVCFAVRRYIRQSPIVGLDRTKQLTIIDPVAGTA